MNLASFFRLLNPILMIFLALYLGVVVARRYRVDWSLYGIGMLTFIGSQLLHIPFNLLVLIPGLEKLNLSVQGTSAELVAIALALGLSAGIFEELARYIGFRVWLKDNRTWPQSLMFGAGHGGVEALLIGGLTLWGFFQAIVLLDTDLSTQVPVDRLQTVQAQLDAFWALPWYQTLLGAVERAAALCIHLALTILVLQSFVRKNLTWLGLAVGFHAVVDALTVFLLNRWSILATEGVIVLLGVLSLIIVFWLRPQTSPPVFGTTESQPSIPLPIKPPSPDQLEDSRYV